MRFAIKKTAILAAALLLSIPVSAQFTVSGSNPGWMEWETFSTPNYRIIFPRGLDSLARRYAVSLEKYRVLLGNSSGYMPNEFYKTPMPAVLNACTAYSNGSVSWMPRLLTLYSNPEAYSPESSEWIEELALHESRHISQMQFTRGGKKFRWLEVLTGEIVAGIGAGAYPGPAFLEGDAVVAETALSESGRGRAADFLQYYRVSFAEGQMRNYWRWVYGSQKLYTPDYYRAGYMLHAGMRNTFDEPRFTAYYFGRIFEKKLYPFFNLQKSVKEVSGMKFGKAFRAIEDDFAADWAANDTLRMEVSGGFTQGERISNVPRLFRSYTGTVVLDSTVYAVRSGLDVTTSLVRMTRYGTAVRLADMNGSCSRLSASPVTGRIYWTEYKGDVRWEKMSSSRLMSYDPATRKKKVVAGSGRYYNPAASRQDSTVAVVSNRFDGRTDVLVLQGITGQVLQTFTAPDGMQAVEPAWVDGTLCSSAITEDGFGIYRVDGWKELLRPGQLKITRLFGHDGRLWFASDRDGTTELHSLGPDGVLRQETALRFGGSNFTFDGEDLLYSALTVADNGLYRMPSDSLLGIAVSPKPFPRPIADKLSLQEDTMAVAPVPVETVFSETVPYEKGNHLSGFHSWAPFYTETDDLASITSEITEGDITAGATAWFQNELETSYGEVALGIGPYYAMPSGKFYVIPAFHAQWTYAGWFPVVKLTADAGGRNALGAGINSVKSKEGLSINTSLDTLSVPRLSLTALGYLPLNLSSGGWNRGVVPSLSFTLTNDRSAVPLRKGRNLSSRYASPLSMTAGIRAYAVRKIPSSCIFPRLGIGASFAYRDTPLNTEGVTSKAVASLYGYLPGILRTHGLKLSGSYSRTADSGFYLSEELKADAEYALPFAAVDWSFLSPLTYIRNFEARLYASYEETSMGMALDAIYGSDNQEAWLGAGVLVHLSNVAWAPVGARLGVKYLYNPFHPELSGPSVIATMDL